MQMHWTRWLLPVFILGLVAGYSLSVWNLQESGDAPSQVQEAGQPDGETQNAEEGMPIRSYPSAIDAEITETAAPSFAEQSTRMQVLAQSGRWEALFKLAGSQLAIAPEGAKEEFRAYLEIAYEALVRRALDGGKYEKAGQLLQAAGTELGESARRLILQAELKTQRKDLRGALKDLHRALSLEPLLTEEIYPATRQLTIQLAETAGGALAPEEKIQLLSGEIIADPGYAPYYVSLGRLYYQQGQYAEALTQLSYALQLEPALNSQLSPMIEAARQRRDTPDVVEIPLQTDGHTHYVNVELDDSGLSHQFVLDTGASMVAITTKLATELGLTPTAGQPKIELHTAKGSIQVPVIRLRSIRVGAARLANVQAVILDSLEGADGLLGLSFLNRFNVDINHNDNKLLLSRRQ